MLATDRVRPRVGNLPRAPSAVRQHQKRGAMAALIRALRPSSWRSTDLSNSDRALVRLCLPWTP